MEIKWLGNNCFYIKGSDATVLLDPVEGAKPADIVITTEDSYKLPESEFSFDWPGEYEAKGVLIHAIPEKNEDKDVRHLSMEVDGIRIGLLANSPTISEETVAELGDIDILMIPVTMKPKEAMKIIEEIDPRMVVPSMADNENADLPGFFKEAGQAGLEATDKLKIKNKSDLDSESIAFVNLSL